MSSFSFFFLNLYGLLFIYLFIYFWLCWVFVSVRGLLSCSSPTPLLWQAGSLVRSFSCGRRAP